MNLANLGPRAWVHALLHAALAATLVGCASGPIPAPVLLTLPNAGASAPASAQAASAPATTPDTLPLLAVRRIAIPEYLVARRVRYRADPSTLAEWPNTFWAERIEIGVSRVFVSSLRARLPGWTICENNCPDRAPALVLQVELMPMDYLRGAQRLQAHARVALSRGQANPTLLRTQTWDYEIASPTDTAQGQAQAVADLLRQVAAATAQTVITTPR